MLLHLRVNKRVNMSDGYCKECRAMYQLNGGHVHPLGPPPGAPDSVSRRERDFSGAVQRLRESALAVAVAGGPVDYIEPTVPCGLCGQPTTYLGTKRCNRCWELEHRIQMEPELARKILAAIT